MNEQNSLRGWLLWHYIDGLRRRAPGEEPPVEGISQEEITELVETLGTARLVRAALEAEAEAAPAPAAVRERVLAGAAAPRRRWSWRLPRMVPAWQLGVTAAALVAALFFTFLPEPAADAPLALAPPVGQVARVRCSEARQEAVPLLTGNVETERAAALWYHYYRCRPCLNHFQQQESDIDPVAAPLAHGDPPLGSA